MPEERHVVGLARCETYDRVSVRDAVRIAIERAGGLPEIREETVLLKANLLAPSPPEAAVTTHPEVLRGVISEVRRSTDAPGLAIHISDTPGYIFTDAESLLRRTGVADLCRETGVTAEPLADLGVSEVSPPTFRVLREARIAKRYLDAPYRINVAKLKTHVETEMTGCIKNIFGTADTDTRKKAHRSRSQMHLAEAIVDLYTVRPPEFHVMDAIVGMEGDGPSHGRPKPLGWVLAGRNALAVDWVACTIMGYAEPMEIPLIRAAASRGIGPAARAEILPVGADWEALPSPGFKKSSGALRLLPTYLRGMAHNLVRIYPHLARDACVRCGICREVCPVDAIRDRGTYPDIDSAACVRCLCCHEMCPTGAMRVRKNALAAIVSRFRGE